MCKVFISVFSLYPDSKPSCLCIAQIRTASNLKILFLPWRPCLYVAGLHFQVCQIPGAALKRTHRYIQRAEQIYRIFPQLVVPIRAFFRFAHNNHFLFFKLMDTVNASLLNSMSAFFFTETWRIARESLRKLILIQHCINEFSNHRMLTCTDQI